MAQKPVVYSLELVDAVAEAPTIKTFTFNTAGQSFSFTAGQYMRVALEGVVDDPRGNRREFSISSPATKSSVYVSLTTTVEPSDSPFKNRLNSLKPGERAAITGPFGKFTLSGLQTGAEAVFIAGGIGITPFRSMILTELAAESHRRITLIYSSRTTENLVFRREFDELQAKHPNFKVHYTITRPDSNQTREHVGRIDAEYVGSLTRPENSVYYLAGPPAMVQELSDQLIQKLPVGRDRVKVEKFTGY
ncbi:MAG: hypothetical protein M1357_03190 [Candidatus Marsarchaeota archaeon]|nr:hypothetical protein [Candidatus Marsarchaeota archaeon]